MTFEIKNEADAKRWNQLQYAEALKYCQRHQLPVLEFNKKDSRVLPPVLAVWHVILQGQPKRAVWIVGGEVMMDHVDASVAKDAREALRHFSMTWQLKASALEEQLENDTSGAMDPEEQRKVIQTMVEKAEALYELYQNDSIWGTK
jgi:hypothetical protein